MKIKTIKTHIISVIFNTIISLFIISCSLNNAGNRTDEKLKELRAKSQQITLNQTCKKLNLSEKECKELGDKNSTTSTSGDEFIKSVNNNCEERKYSDKKCEEFKEFVMENLRRDINGEEMITDEKFSPLKPTK
jgi:hypothetical protein